MVRRLIGFAFVVLKLLVFKVCGIIGISKIEFFNFSDTERVKKKSKLIEVAFPEFPDLLMPQSIKYLLKWELVNKEN